MKTFDNTLAIVCGRVVAALLVLVLVAVPLQSLVSAETSTTGGWLTAADPEIKYSELSFDYVVPSSGSFNADCDVKDFNVVTREAKTRLTPPYIITEQRHQSTCAVFTPRGLTDGNYLDAGVPAGKFVGAGGPIAMVPNSKALMSFGSGATNLDMSASFYDAIVPAYNDVTGEVQLNLAGHHYMSDQAGHKVYLRPNSIGYSSDGKWMIAESVHGFIRVDLSPGSEKILKFTNSGFTYGSGTNPRPRVAISTDGRYAAVASKSPTFKIYDLATCGSEESIDITQPINCQYKDIEPFLRNQFSNYSEGYYIRFASSDLLTFVAAYTSSGVSKRAAVRMAPGGQIIEDVAYLALGDSFSSGEGAYNYEIGTDNTNPRNKCHLSKNSYPYLAADSLGLSSNSYNVACSGATSVNYNSAQKDQGRLQESPLRDWLPGYQGQREYLKGRAPSVVTISMIGNDIGFSNKIKRCIGYTDSCFHFREDRESIAQEIHGKFNTLVGLYDAIQTDTRDAKVYVLGYPQLVATQECDANVSLDLEERNMARGMVSYLNAVIKAAAEKAGVAYVDIENAFAGHQLCEPGAKAVNGLTAGDDLILDIGPIGNESFHPNVLGHALMSRELLEQSTNFTRPMPEANPNKTPPFENTESYNNFIGNAPSNGILIRGTYTVLSGLDLVVSGVPFVPAPVEEYLKPSSIVEVWINSTPQHIGTLTTNENSEITGELTIPNSVAPGYHTLHLYGQNISGEQVDLYKTIYVAASENDLDGDGVVNQEERCLAVEPAGLDVDRDGADDACDPEITDPPADSTSPEVSGAPDRLPNVNGWYNKDVVISWAATDPEPSSGVPTQPATTVAALEGDQVYTSGQSCDPLNNCATGSLGLKIDKTAPALGSATWGNNPKPTTGQATVTVSVVDPLSGVEEAEYYIGDTDPGQGNGATMQVGDGTVSVGFGTDFPTGVYKITVRAKDKAGNWSVPISDYLVVYDPFGTRMTGKRVLLPSLANGDALPGLINNDQTDKAKFGFNVRYDKDGNIHRNSDFQFTYKTGIKCHKPALAQNCHDFELNATSISWLTTQDINDSTGIFQGMARLEVDGVTSNVRFRITGLDGERLDTVSPDHLTLKIYSANANPSTAAPIYRVGAEVLRGNIKVRKW